MSIREIAVGESQVVFAAMAALRPQLSDEAQFAAAVDGCQRPQGYRLIGSFEDGAQTAVAVAGFRVANSIAWGRYLYIDDLSTVAQARGRGHARALLDWLGEEARRLGCDQLHLDSGFGEQRHDAHRLYLNAGLVLASHHFARRV